MPQVISLQHQRLGRRLMWLTLLVSSLFATLITATQLVLEYRRDIAAIQQRLTEIEAAYLPSVRQALWVVDTASLQAVTDGLQRLPDFAFAEIRNDGGVLASTGIMPADASLSRSFAVTYEFRGQQLTIGSFKVAGSSTGPLRRTWDRLWFLLLLNLLKTTLVATALLLLVRHMITRPVIAMQRQAQAMAAGDLDTPLQLEARYPASTHDEIHELAHAVETMRINLRDRSAELVQTNDQLNQTLEELKLAASVFEHTQEAIMITDGNSRILSVNPAFTAITGFTSAEAIGQTPRILRSQHQDKDFYDGMWRTLGSTGEWRGELWNRRKNGEAYLQWTSINTINTAAGEPVRRIAVMSDITEMHRKDEHIRHQAYHDALTGLPNRLLLEDRLEHAIKQAERENWQLATLFLDLDRFKIVNDSLGHLAGDELLRQAAGRLKQCIRGSDTVARLGGDEFVILLNIDHIDDAAHVAEKILESIKASFTIDNQVVHVGTSVGISMYPQDGHDVVTLMRNADTAMYAAKEAGRGTFRFFDTEMNANATERLHTEAGLRQAIVSKEFILHYQPKICLPTGKICGMEALIRWIDPERGMVPPGDFIPLAEETGLISAIGDWALDEACRQMRLWADAGIEVGGVAVNVSARQLDDPGFIDRIGDTMQRHGISPAQLQIEVTESTVMTDPQHATDVLSRIAELGLLIAVDDFGTGYSSFSYLKRLPIHQIKVDRSFVEDIGVSREGEEIVTAIVHVAHALGLELVAEGVENETQANFLRELGCQFAQGYFYAKPLQATDFEQLVRNQAK